MADWLINVGLVLFAGTVVCSFALAGVPLVGVLAVTGSYSAGAVAVGFRMKHVAARSRRLHPVNRKAAA